MPIDVLMPALSPTMTEGKVARWQKQEGDTVAPGDVIAEVETDKATMEVEAVDEGTLGQILVPAGSENIPVNQPIARILEEGESPDALEQAPAAPEQGGDGPAPAAQEAPTEGAPAQPQPAPQQPAAPAAPQAATPAAGDPPMGETRVIAMREALRDALAEEMRRDDRVFAIGEEIGQYEGAYKVTQGLLAEFGERRVVDTPITEHAFTGLAVGAAFGGLMPVLEFMTFNFAMQAIDHIVNSAAKTRYMSGGQMASPIVFRGPNGPPPRVAAQHSQCYASWYMHVPGLKVVSPYSPGDAKGLLKAAIRDPNPVVFLEHELLYGNTGPVAEDPGYVLPLDRARVERAGDGVTLVAYSRAVQTALDAAEQLAHEGIEAEVINLRSLRPLDAGAITASVQKTNRVVSVEEGWPVAGVGAEIAAVVNERAFDWLDAPPARVAPADVPQPYAANLEQLAVPSAEDVADAARQVCYRA